MRRLLRALLLTAAAGLVAVAAMALGALFGAFGPSGAGGLVARLSEIGPEARGAIAAIAALTAVVFAAESARGRRADLLPPLDALGLAPFAPGVPPFPCGNGVLVRLDDRTVALRPAGPGPIVAATSDDGGMAMAIDGRPTPPGEPVRIDQATLPRILPIVLREPAGPRVVVLLIVPRA
jgi:hypothetical protein